MSVVQDVVHVKGGYNTRGETGKSLHYRVGEKMYVFVQAMKNAEWFLKGVGGSKVQKGNLKPVRVLQLLRDKFQECIGKEAYDEATAAVAESQSNSQEADETPDPMDALDELVPVKVKKVKKPKQTRVKVRSGCREFLVPTRPPCVACDKDGTTLVCVYLKREYNKGIGTLYVRMDCIGWLLAYAADELHFMGVGRSKPEPIVEAKPNCPAVAGLNLKWDFCAKAWDAKFVEGAFGGKTKRMDQTNLDKDVWDKLRTNNLVENTWLRATSSEKRTGLKELLILWCAAFSRGAADEHDATMGSPNSKERGDKRSFKNFIGTDVGSSPGDDSDATAVADMSADDDDESLG